MDKNINSNGFEYVDLELPSGTLWATCNVGAFSPSESGLYFQWGDIKGYTKEQIGKEKKFEYDFSDYKFSIDGSNANFSKYTTKCETLDLEDDAAHVHMGGDWHIPTPDQIYELLDNTTTTWMTYDNDGVGGIEFTSKRDISKSIFIPASGYVRNGSIRYYGNEGYLWSSKISTENINSGQYLNLTYEGIHLYVDYRNLGFPVRGVIDKKSNLSELIRNEIKNNFRVKVTKYYAGNVEVQLLYNGEVISSDMC